MRLLVGERLTMTASVTIKMKSNMWLHWGHIAARYEAQALSAHRDVVERWGKPDTQGLMRPEMEACLLTVTAAACCIDAIHFEVANSIGRDWDTRGKRRPDGSRMPAWEYWMGTFERAFGPGTRTWASDMEWLVGLRNDSVHPKPKTHIPVAHPSVATSVQQEFATYTYEAAAKRSVDLVERVYEVAFVVTNPRAVAELRSMRFGD